MPHAIDIARDISTSTSNPGLSLTRLAPPLTSQDWTGHLRNIVNAGLPVGYGSYFERLRARTAAGPETRRVLCASAQAPVICGMGERTPGENGLTLHPVYGVPYLPGTSLKGILCAWVLTQDWGPEWSEGGRYFNTLFGQGGDQGAAAVVDILDALPFPPKDNEPLLSVDVLTPHFACYYQGTSAPLGWEGPNPVQFLTATAGTCFRIVVEGDRGWVGKATEWLALALAEHGVGAKSRAGYGRLTCSVLGATEPAEESAAARSKRARMTVAEALADEAQRRNAALASSLRNYGKDALQSVIEQWLLGEQITSKLDFSNAFSQPPQNTSQNTLDAIKVACEHWNLIKIWKDRISNRRADEARKKRAADLISRWKEIFS